MVQQLAGPYRDADVGVQEPVSYKSWHWPDGTRRQRSSLPALMSSDYVIREELKGR